jgi:hypothetical protein
MKILLMVLILAPLLNSCGANRGDSRKDIEIKEVMDEGLKDLSYFNVDTSRVMNIDSYVFGELPTGLIGLCQSADKDTQWNIGQTDTGNHITISKEYWGTHDQNHKKALILHEIGHCAWGLRHQETGIMTANLVYFSDEAQYWKLVEDFSKELPKK